MKFLHHLKMYTLFIFIFDVFFSMFESLFVLSMACLEVKSMESRKDWVQERIKEHLRIHMLCNPLYQRKR